MRYAFQKRQNVSVVTKWNKWKSPQWDPPGSLMCNGSRQFGSPNTILPCLHGKTCLFAVEPVIIFTSGEQVKQESFLSA